MKRSSLGIGILIAALPCVAHAQQFTIVDQTYEHKYEEGSHHRVKPTAETPSNWKVPVDYTKGTVYGHMEILSRPSTDKVAFVICMESVPSYACATAPTYTTQKSLDWSQPFSKMFQADKVDWTKRPSIVALIQKDSMYRNVEVKDLGADTVMRILPSKLRVVLTFVAEGSTYKPPPGVSPDAGVPPPKTPKPDAAAKNDAASEEVVVIPAGSGGMSGSGGASGGAQLAGQGGQVAEGSAGRGAPPITGGAGGKGAAPAAPVPVNDDDLGKGPLLDPKPVSTGKSGGCAVGGSGGVGFLVMAAVALWVLQRRRP